MRALSLLLSLFLAGCAYFQDPRDREGTIISAGNFRAGSGVIRSVAVLPNARPVDPKAPPRDPKAPEPDPNLYRVCLHMDQGAYQCVDVDNGSFAEGDAVELTNDGRVERVSGTRLLDLFR